MKHAAEDVAGKVKEGTGELTVRDLLDAIRNDGTGAQRQILAFRRDEMERLRQLYRSGSETR